jgi:hypothetical protein
MNTILATLLCMNFMDPMILKDFEPFVPEISNQWRETLHPDGIAIVLRTKQRIVLHPIRSLRVTAENEQLANGLTPECLTIGSLLGCITFDKAWTDFRNQTVPAGIYALRYALQPVTDDHADTAPTRHFALLVPMGTEPGPVPSQEILFKQSLSVTSKHPAVMPLLESRKNTARSILKLEGDCWAVPLEIPAATETKQAILYLRLIIIGKSPAAQP